MTYCNPAFPYRAKQRSRPSQNGYTRPRAAWFDTMLCGLLAMLYARGFLSGAQFRRALPARTRRESYFYANIQVRGCTHLRAALHKKQGLVTGDLELHDEARRRQAYGPQRTHRFSFRALPVTGKFGVIDGALVRMPAHGPIRASPYLSPYLAQASPGAEKPLNVKAAHLYKPVFTG